MTTSKLSNRELTNLVINRSMSFVTKEAIDDTYGECIYTYTPSKDSPEWLIHKSPASNWTYCPCCGNAAGQCGLECSCDDQDESCFEKISNSDLFRLLKKWRNSADSIRFEDAELIFDFD